MNNSYLDLVAVMMKDLPRSLLVRPPYWCPEQYVLDRDIPLTTPDVQAQGRLFTRADDLFDLHSMYSQLFPEFGEACKLAVNSYYETLTASQQNALTMWLDPDDGCVKFRRAEGWLKVWSLCRRGIAEMSGVPPSEEVVRMIEVIGIVGDYVPHKYVKVGPVRFTADMRDGEGDWALSRPPLVMRDAEGEMITQPEFGRVKAVYTHMGPNEKVEVVVRMEWYQNVAVGEDLYHPLQRNPLVGLVPRRDRRDVMWLAKDLIPLICWAAPDYDRPSGLSRQIMLSRSWGVLRVLGFPPPAHPDDPFAFVGV